MSLSATAAIHTPPTTPSPKKLAKSPAGRTQSSQYDSGVEDLCASPNPPHKRQVRHELLEDESLSDDDSTYSEPSKGQSTRCAIAKNAFETEGSIILFEAIDKLHSLGSGKYLEIPQLIVVGGQSAGKSSLLQTLTGISFPINAECCTRFPTRIVSKRTPPGSKESFTITIDEPEVEVRGILPAPVGFKTFKREGTVLTNNVFIKAMEEVSSKLGIKNGRTPGRKNFASEVLRVELSGPSRSHFSILDLPGQFRNARGEITALDVQQVQNLMVSYMEKPENIVVMVADAPTDLAHQDVPTLVSKHVPRERTIGVFTKCDMAGVTRGVAKTVVRHAIGDINDNITTLPQGWFCVKNRTPDDPDGFDLEASEAKLFGSYPWNQVPTEQLGSKALKSFLGDVFNNKISNCLPKLKESITQKLHNFRRESDIIGEPRDNHLAKYIYITGIVEKFKRRADKSLDRPGYQDDSIEIRRKTSELRDGFNKFMRCYGGAWDFEEDQWGTLAAPPTEPENASSVLPMNVPIPPPSIAELRVELKVDEDYRGLCNVGSPDLLLKSIHEEHHKFQADFLTGTVNPDLYLRMYQLQVRNWGLAVKIYLTKVKTSVQNCIVAILDDVCPSTAGTRILREEVDRLVDGYFNDSFNKMLDACNIHCEREMNRERLYTDDETFLKNLTKRREMRFRASFNLIQDRSSEDAIISEYFHRSHWCHEQTVVNDVHDIIKGYYEISLGNFLQNIANEVDLFVRSEKGPLRWLNPKMIKELSEEQISQLGSEDTSTLKRREEIREQVEKLNTALKIIADADQKIKGLRRH